MNKDKGFTLVELLAVIVILAIILAIAIPGISSIIDSTKKNAYNDQLELFKRAADLYNTKNGIDSGNTSVTLKQLIDDDFLTPNIKDPISGKPFDTGITVIVDRSDGSADYQIQENPALVTGMIPVYYDDTTGKWRKADILNPSNQWFDYNNQKWANAVTVTTSSRGTTYQDVAVGDTIEMADINAMFVWIPRYKYLIPTGTEAREILVSFEAKNTPKSVGNAESTYYTHPAFTFGGAELSGIWVGKFETTGGDITAPTILPDKRALKGQTVKDMYDSVKTYMQGNATFGFTNDNDIHMMKNTEWGAVAYLTGSRYGKYGNANYDSTHKELYMNNSSGGYTGRSSGAAGGGGILTPTEEYIEGDYYTYDGKCASIYAGLASPCTGGSTGQPLTDKTSAYGASTTGTIYGIYDMSGGSWEYVMGVYEPNPIPTTGISDNSEYSLATTNSQYDLLTIESKYYDRYLTDSAVTGAILGDATEETSGWYGDYNWFVSAEFPWFNRGGNHRVGAEAGAFYFCFAYLKGAVSGDVSFRVVLGPQA